MSERLKVPEAAWTAGMEAVAVEPRDAAENARTWRVVYHVLHALGYDCGETWPVHGATPEAIEKIWTVRGE